MNALNYQEDLQRKLGKLEARIAEARRRLDSGKPADMIKAAGDLAVLEARRQEFAKSFAEAKAKQAGDWSQLHTKLAEDFDAIMTGLDDWITRH